MILTATLPVVAVLVPVQLRAHSRRAGTHVTQATARQHTTKRARLVSTTTTAARAVPAMPPLPAVGRVAKHHFPPNAAPVTLSFDDGPDPVLTPLFLAVLAHYDVRATFFLIGEKAAANRQLVENELAAGHAIGNHTWSHADLTTLDAEGFKAEIDRNEELLRTFVHTDVPCVRPPFGRINAFATAEVHQRGLKVVRWTADTGDWHQPTSATIAHRALAGAHPGAIILMHDTYAETLDALPQIIVGIEEMGLRIAPVCGLPTTGA